MKRIISPDKALELFKRDFIASDDFATDNFSWLELVPYHSFDYVDINILNNLQRIASVLNIYRSKLFNNKPITITSGYRSVEYTKKLIEKGTKTTTNSYHCKGLALDFFVKDFTILEIYSLMDLIHFGGVEKTNSDWVHIDLRGSKLRFDNHNNILDCHYNEAKHNIVFGKNK